MNLRQIADGIAFAEGPVVLSNGDVLVVEVMGGRLIRITPDGSKRTVAELGGGPNGAAIGPDGRCYVCNNGGLGPAVVPGLFLPGDAPIDTSPGCIQVVDLAVGTFEALYRSTDATPFWAPNDLVFDEAGGFWFTDFGRNRGRIRTRGAVYYARADGSHIEEAIFGLDAPNGIGLSPDGRTLYVADTFASQLWRFALSAPGTIDRDAGQTPHGGSIVGRAGAGQYMDSLGVDGAGNVCVASPGQGAILVFPPEGGVPERIAMPDFMVTNIAFGGPDLKTAYITLASSGRLVAMEWPRPGLRLNWC